MWCGVCHVIFSWNTGSIETGPAHNPHALRWMRENNITIPRARGDNPCEIGHNRNNRTYFLTMFYNILRRHNFHNEIIILHSIEVCLGETRYHMKNYIDPSKLRISYLVKHKSLEVWKKKLFSMERQNSRYRCQNDLVTLIGDYGDERIRDVYNRLQEVYNNEIELVLEFLINMEQIRDFFNRSMSEEWKILGGRTPLQIKICGDGSWSWSKK